VVEILAARSLDHKSLWVRFCPNIQNRTGAKRFIFEAAWNLDEACADVIKSVWNKEPDGVVSLSAAKTLLENCQKALIARVEQCQVW
jgi:hypothetical protein